MFEHDLPFDPTYGYSLDDLLRVPAPLEPADFGDFWRKNYASISELKTTPQIGPAKPLDETSQVASLTYQSTEGWEIQGWIVTPRDGRIERGIVSLHGYGGQGEPDGSLKVPNAAVLYPGLRGLPPTRRHGYPEVSAQHVLFNLEDRDEYILGGCVRDAWLAVTALLELYPQTASRIGLMGGSFGGGIGALSLPWDQRIQRGHFKVPTFGNQPLRLILPCTGSGNAVTQYFQRTGKIPPALAYFDSATAARHITVPMHCSCALFDPSVPPPGQFAVYNAIPGEKQLHITAAGHFNYPDEHKEEQERIRQVSAFFAGL